MNTHTRNIKKGDQFTHLLPLPKNNKVFLGTGDTFVSLKNMRKIIFQTLNETKKLAKELEKPTVAETVKSIKDFIYWHIQYLQDQTEQQLHSPSNTWQNRALGVDCKSYSIFASSLLTNLGIANNLTQIKQLNYNSDYWSHVYVSLPNHNLVIDGTVLYDNEPQYAEKFDEPILQNGLQGLGQLASACNWCDNNNSTSTLLENNYFTGDDEIIGGARLPFTNLSALLTDTDTEKSTNQVRHNSSEPFLISNRLKLARVKAIARKRKILLLKV